MTSATQQVKKSNSQIRAELIDEIMDRYVDSREQCLALERTYDNWSNGPTAERKLAFEAYKAALDLEEHAALVYADRVNRFDGELTSRYRLPILGRRN
jgi:hypothetical protein